MSPPSLPWRSPRRWAPAGRPARQRGRGAVGNVVIEDANNYSSTSSLKIPVVETKAATDLSISWDGITQDLLCHPAGTIDNVAFLRIGNMTQAQVEDKLAKGQLTSNEVTTYREFHTAGATSTMLSTLSFGHRSSIPATDYVVAAGTQYLCSSRTGRCWGSARSRWSSSRRRRPPTTPPSPPPTPAAARQLPLLHRQSEQHAVSIPTAGPWKIDWSQVTKDSFGQKLDFSLTNLDKVEVGFFQGKQPSEIQADFLNVEQDATSLYTYSVPAGQKYVDLMSAPTSGGAFPGFTDTGGTWAVAVLCTSCQVPAPVVFSILQPQ